jgi:succinate-acetate transporter protein
MSNGSPGSPFWAGEPLAVGVPTFLAAVVGLGLYFIGYVPAVALGATVPVVLLAGGLGCLITTLWAIALGQGPVASIFGIFAGFFLSFAALVEGLLHNWFEVVQADVPHTIGLFLITWIVVVGTLAISTLRLPAGFTVLFVLFELALVMLLIGFLNGSTGALKVGGYALFLVALVSVYLYVGVQAALTGGNALPLGRPLLTGGGAPTSADVPAHA